MSQIRKFQAGGKFILDGKEYDVDDKFLQQFDDYAKSVGGGKYFGDLRNALRSGKTVEYDSFKNTIKGDLPFFSDNTNRQARSKRERSRLGRWSDATFNTPIQEWGEELSKLKGFNPYTTDNPSNLTDLKYFDTKIDYNLDKDGKTRIYSNSPENQAIEDRILNTIDFLSLGEEGNKKYNISGLNNVSALQNWYRNNPNRLNELITNIKSGNLSDQDIDDLRSIRILQDAEVNRNPAGTTSQVGTQPNQTVENRNIIEGVNPDLLKKYGISFTRGDDENIYSNSFGSGLYYLGGHPAFAGTNWEEGVAYNGRLYTPEQAQQDPALLEVLRPVYNSLSGTNNEPWLNRWSNFDSMVNYYGKNTSNPWFKQTYDPNASYFREFGDYFTDLKSPIQINDLTDAYNVPEGSTYLAYFDPNNTNKNWLNIPIPSTVLKNPDGTYSTNNSISPREGLFTTQRRLNFDEYFTDKSGNKYVTRNVNIGASSDKETLYIKDGKVFIKYNNNIIPINNKEISDRLLSDPTSVTKSELDSIRRGNRKSGISRVVEGLPKYPKFQMGGYLNLDTNVNTNRIKTEEKSNVEKSAKLKDIKEHGLNTLTEADKLELGAMVGDLGGLIASFIPGGSIVAAGAGAGSTVAQFISDVKRDGLDWGDAGRALGSLGLDALTLIPGAGIAGKTGKIIKNLHRSSKLIGGLFAGYGLTEATKSLSKLVNNEDWTVDDLRNITVGLQSALGLKRLTLDRPMATKRGQKIPTEKPNINNKNYVERRNELIDNKLKQNPDLAQQYTNANTQSVDYEAASKILSKLDKASLVTKGVTNKAGNNVTKLGSMFKRTKREPRELRELDFSNQSGWLGKFMQSQRNRAIRRWTVNNPEGYIDPVSTRTGFITGREIPVFDRVRYNNKELLGRGERYQLPNNVSKRISDLVNRKGLSFSRVRRGNLAGGQPTYQYNVNNENASFNNVRSLLNYLRNYKDGGKIKKYQLGDKYNYLIPYKPNSFGIINNPILSTRNVTPTNNIITGDQLATRANEFNNNSASNYLTNKRKSSELPEFNLGVDPRNRLNIVKDDLLGVAGLLSSYIHNKRATDVQKKAINDAMQAMPSAPQEIYNRFTDYGVNSAYQNAAQKKLLVNPAVSDPLLNQAIQQNAKDQANQLQLEGRLKTSELYSNHLNQQDELRRNYAGIRTDVANQRKQNLASLNMSLASLDAAKTTANWRSLENYLLEWRNKVAQDKSIYDNFNNQILRNEADTNYQNAINSALSKYKGEWVNLPADSKNNYGNFDNWVSATYPEEVNTIISDANRNSLKYLVPMYNKMLRFHKLPTFAKGGKSTSKRTASEQIWINSNEEAAKAIKLLNENVIKLFLKAMS